ncbi:hypothetical protein [Streptomyces hesseae]|uniref:Transposase n=1 Tax=Streptomyces hesseae TaxID=3075519 RepID=A0ABU2SXG7_9ACTN|nr:hypothetical protein [Streptomyces sp. DSM 40473]MDT0453408.1 hypothetical protein [Streptomyces sp. DSM 40473]
MRPEKAISGGSPEPVPHVWAVRDWQFLAHGLMNRNWLLKTAADALLWAKRDDGL